MTCPFCISPLEDDHEGACPACGGDTSLTPVEARHAVTLARMRRRLRQVCVVGGVSAVVLCLAVILLAVPSGGLVVIGGKAVLLVGHAVVLRWTQVNPARRCLSPQRRLFARWIPRLAFGLVGTSGYLLLAVPGVNLLAVPATWIGITVGVHAYLAWSMGQEVQGRGALWWEKGVLVVLGLTAAVALVALLVVAAFAGLLVAEVGVPLFEAMGQVWADWMG